MEGSEEDQGNPAQLTKDDDDPKLETTFRSSFPRQDKTSLLSYAATQ
jgi:hypothetical protein